MKPEYLLPLPVASALWLILLHCQHLRAADRILACLYLDHRPIWEALGSPTGWQWSPPGQIAVPWCIWEFPREWLRTDPDWVAHLPELREDFDRIRVAHRRMLWPALPTFAAAVVVLVLGITLLQP